MARVLIVDDRSTNRHYLRQVLAGAGYEVAEATDGAEALASVRKAPPELLITDLLMPVMGGYDLVRALREDPRSASMPVIFYTATYRSSDAHRLAEACGVSVVLPKPTDPQTLLAAVGHLLGMAPQAAPQASLSGNGSPSALAALGERIAGHIGNVHNDHALLHGLMRAQSLQGPEREGLDAILQRFERHLGRVQHSASRLFALIELALDLAGERDLGAFLRMLCDAGRRIVDAEAAVLLLFDERTQRVHRVESSGLPAPAPAPLQDSPLQDGLVGRAWQAGKALRQGDGHAPLEALPAGLELADGPARAFLGVPLQSSTGRFGLLVFLDHRPGRAFDDEAEMLALALAGEFGVLFELFDANEALQQRAVELQLEVTQRQRAEQALEQHRRELASFSQRLLEQEKATTRRLAQALHDELGQTLAAMRLIYDACTTTPLSGTPPPKALMAQLDQLIDDANRQVRQVLVELRPPLLDEHGLAAALDNELRQRERLTGGVALELQAGQAPADQRWPPEVEYAAFMIAREAVHNALRHAQSSKVRVELTAEGDGLALSVGDDGRGLPHDPLPASAAGHLGMVSMRERAVAIGATLDVQSAPGQGTLVQLRWRA